MIALVRAPNCEGVGGLLIKNSFRLSLLRWSTLLTRVTAHQFLTA